MSNPEENENLRSTVIEDPSAFNLDMGKSKSMDDWIVRSDKYGIDMSFENFALRAGLNLSQIFCLLTYNHHPFSIGPLTYRPVPIDKPGEIDGIESTYKPVPITGMDVKQNRGSIRRSIRGLDGDAVAAIRERLGLSSDAEAVREAVLREAQRIMLDF